MPDVHKPFPAEFPLGTPVNFPPIAETPPEPAARQAEATGEIPLVEPTPPPPEGESDHKPMKRDEVPLLHVPKLATKPLWPAPKEIGGRAWIGVVLIIIIAALYGYFLSFYHAGAHGGVDQAGYLMTARLITGDGNPDALPRPHVPAKVEAPATAPTTAPGFLVWAGGESGYTNTSEAKGDHPAPAPIMLNPRWDWLRNRLSFVPGSPFQFASRMCIITEPYGPAVAGMPEMPGTPAARNKPAVATRPATEAKAAEYRVYAKYPFGFPLMAAVGREVAGWFDRTEVVIVEKGPAATQPAGAVANGSPTTQAAATQAVAATQAADASAGAIKITKAPAAGRGFWGMYVVNPLCTVLACFFAYFLYRQAVSPFMALMGVLWLACNPLTLVYANDANSHASTLFCVCAGFWGLVSFLRTGQTWGAGAHRGGVGGGVVFGLRVHNPVLGVSARAAGGVRGGGLFSAGAQADSWLAVAAGGVGDPGARTGAGVLDLVWFADEDGLHVLQRGHGVRVEVSQRRLGRPAGRR
jgi:hypothetical protein